MDKSPALLSINPNLSEDKLVETSLPHFDDPRKTDYLVMRAVSFSHEESLRLLNVTGVDYNGWTVYDPTFAYWEGVNLRQLQRNLGAEVMRARFMRCVFLQLSIDSDILTKRAFEVDDMSDADRADAREAGKRYGAGNIAAMLKALEPERDDGPGTGKVIKVDLSVTVSDAEVEAHMARKVGARQLLARFSANSEQFIDVDGKVIDDESAG